MPERTDNRRFDAAAFLAGLFDSAPAGGPDSVAVSDPDPVDVRPDDLPEAWRELYEDRAAAREYDGGEPREVAEHRALREIVARMRAARLDDAGRCRDAP